MTAGSGGDRGGTKNTVAHFPPVSLDCQALWIGIYTCSSRSHPTPHTDRPVYGSPSAISRAHRLHAIIPFKEAVLFLIGRPGRRLATGALVPLFRELPAASAHLYTEGACMAIQKTEKIWHNGKLIAWDDATCARDVARGELRLFGVRRHPLLRRCPPARPSSAPRSTCSACSIPRSIYRMDVDFTRDRLVAAWSTGADERRVALLHPPHRSPRIRRSRRQPVQLPTEVYICNYPWGKYLGSDDVARASTSASPPGRASRRTPCPPWPRPAPTT